MKYSGVRVHPPKEVLNYAKGVGMGLAIELQQGTNYERGITCLRDFTAPGCNVSEFIKVIL